MKFRLRALLLGFTSLAIVVVELGQLALDVRNRVGAAEVRLAAQTHRLAAAATPVLLNALVVGDLATAEQVLRHLNSDLTWRQVVLYEGDGRQLMLDASPASLPPPAAPSWLGSRLRMERRETRHQIAAGPRVYAVLAVTPSSRKLEDDLWAGIRSTAATTLVLIGVLLVLMNLILRYGLRPVQELGRSAARLGAGDLSARMPETRLVEIAPTALAFNTMAGNLEQVMAALEQRVAERQRSERRQAARFAVTRALAEPDEPDGALRRILEAIGGSIGWEWGEFWREDPDVAVLRRAVVWHAPHAAAAAFEAPRPVLTFARGAGLLGRVWAGGQAAWALAGVDDPAFGGRAAAAAVGFTTAFAFPVRGRGVTGVMMFFSHDAQPRDGALLATATDLGVQIGQFLDRREAEETLRATEEQLRQAQKMEAIGKLAGGVAHDFNNMLTVVIGRCSLLIRRLGPDDPVGHELDIVRTTAERAAMLTRQLLAFGRKQVLQPRSLDLNAVVDGIAPMLRRLIGEDVEQVIRMRPGLGRVMADPSQIEQVIVNLVVNARDAMPGGGQLTIETAHVDPDAAYARRHPGAPVGAHVMLAVSDTGVGMDAETRARVFEPFFTTKEPGKGTGLGLATVYGIVKQSGGTVEVDSERGQGAVFRIYLPRLDAPAELPPPEAALSLTPSGAETILLVEDQDDVRALAADILRAHGYTVLEAADPVEARQIGNRNHEPIDLLLTDVVMPRASGPELAEELAPVRPEMKVLFMSGYTDQAIVHHGVLDSGVAYLEKPFSVETLTRRVRAVLDAPALVATA
jgi:two-component system cell cycle sensor histidine kinase/response regulator CckA